MGPARETVLARIGTHKELVDWQLGMKLAKVVYRWSQDMPPEERFGLMLQIRRAAISIPSNIAEGYGRESTGDCLRFLKRPRGSLLEAWTQAELAVQLEMLAPSQELNAQIEEEDRVLQGLIRSIKAEENQDTLHLRAFVPPCRRAFVPLCSLASSSGTFPPRILLSTT